MPYKDIEKRRQYNKNYKANRRRQEVGRGSENNQKEIELMTPIPQFDDETALQYFAGAMAAIERAREVRQVQGEIADLIRQRDALQVQIAGMEAERKAKVAKMNEELLALKKGNAPLTRDEWVELFSSATNRPRLEKQGRDFVDRIAKKYPDFPELLEKANPSPTLAAFVMKSKNSEALAYHLAKNPAENERLSALDPFEAGIEIGKLDSQLSNGNLAAAPTGGAPAPAPKGFPANPTKISATEYAQHHPACPSWLKQKNG
jgi:hypothetical protein